MEDNRFSVSIHYRNCARVDVPRVKEVAERVQARHERIRMASGKEVTTLWEEGGEPLIRPTNDGETSSRVGRGAGESRLLLVFSSACLSLSLPPSLNARGNATPHAFWHWFTPPSFPRNLSQKAVLELPPVHRCVSPA